MGESIQNKIRAVNLAKLQCPTLSTRIFKILDERKNHQKRLLVMNTKVQENQIKKILNKSLKIARMQMAITMRQAKVTPDNLPNEDYDEHNKSASNDNDKEEQQDNYESDQSYR